MRVQHTDESAVPLDDSKSVALCELIAPLVALLRVSATQRDAISQTERLLRCVHVRAFMYVCVCVCVTRSRPRGPSKSGRPVNIELIRKAKTGQHKIRKGSQDRSTQIQEPDNTNPRASPGPVKITHADRDSHYTTTGKQKKNTHGDSPNTAATKIKKRNHHYLFRDPDSESDSTREGREIRFPIDTTRHPNLSVDSIRSIYHVVACVVCHVLLRCRQSSIRTRHLRLDFHTR